MTDLVADRRASKETSLVGGDERSLGPHHSGDACRRNRLPRTVKGVPVSETPHDWRPGAIHGDRRPPGRRRFRAGRDSRSSGSTRVRRLARLLHQRGRGRGGPGSRPDGPRGDARGGAGRRGRGRRLCGRLVPPPAGRGARQRSGAPRAARPRDPDVPTGRGPRDRPRGRLLPRRRASTTPTIGPPEWRPSMPSTRPLAIRWRFPGSPRPAWPPTWSGASISSGPTSRTSGST